VFAGTYITEVDVRDRALAWVPDVMRFAQVDEVVPSDGGDAAPFDGDDAPGDPVAGDDDLPPAPREMAA
jgi:ParB family chromosome partitioning protein